MSDRTVMRHFRALPSLGTNRLNLDRAYLTDTDDLFECMRNDNVCRFEVWYPHRSVMETLGFVNDLMIRTEEKKCLEWVIRRSSDSKAIGIINLHDVIDVNSEAEMGFWLGEEYWHCGYASEAARRVLDFAFNQFGLNKVICMCSVENDASEKVIRNIGMTYEGTLRQHIKIKGRFHDIKIFSMLRNEFVRKTQI